MNLTKCRRLEDSSQALLLLLILFSSSTPASEQAISPDLKLHYRGKVLKTTDELFAWINAFHASKEWSLITNLRPSPSTNYNNGVPDTWIWTDVDTGSDGGIATSSWECPVEAPMQIRTRLPHGPNVQYVLYCRTRETQLHRCT